MGKRKRKAGQQLGLFTRKPFKEERKPASFSEMVLGEFHGNAVRLVMKDGEPWWVAADVCRILGFANPRDAVSRLDEDEKGVVRADTLGGKQKVSIVNESGLYNLIFRSDRKDAKSFRRWVTHEVLPSIRKTGGYHIKSPRQLRYARKMKTGHVDTLKARLDTASSHLAMNKECALDGFKPVDFQDMHNLKYLEMVGLKASEVRKLLGMKPHETPLDRMSDIVLAQVNHAVSMARKFITFRTEERGSPLSIEQQKAVMADCLRDVQASNARVFGPEFGYGIEDDPRRGLILDVVRNRLPSPSMS